MDNTTIIISEMLIVSNISMENLLNIMDYNNSLTHKLLTMMELEMDLMDLMVIFDYSIITVND
jgi:hypothetical protein